MDNVLAQADTMRSIPASQCEAEALQLCRSGRRSDVGTNTGAQEQNNTLVTLKGKTGHIKLYKCDFPLQPT